MGTLRSKVLAAFLVGMLTMWSALILRAYVADVNFRLDRLENWAAGQEMLRRMQPAPEQQAAPERSHKGELSQPQRWKV